MARIITTYLLVVLLVSLGFFGVGALVSAQELALVSAQELIDPMQPSPFELEKFRQANGAANP